MASIYTSKHDTVEAKLANFESKKINVSWQICSQMQIDSRNFPPWIQTLLESEIVRFMLWNLHTQVDSSIPALQKAGMKMGWLRFESEWHNGTATMKMAVINVHGHNHFLEKRNLRREKEEEEKPALWRTPEAVMDRYFMGSLVK